MEKYVPKVLIWINAWTGYTRYRFLWIFFLLPVSLIYSQTHNTFKQYAEAATVTPGTQDTFVNVSVMLTGIGNNGNTNPLHTTRTITMVFYNPSVQNQIQSSDTVTFTNGVFSNQLFKVGKLPNGTYQIFIHINGYLQKKAIQNGSDSFTIINGSTITIPQQILLPGDIAPVPGNNNWTYGDNVFDISDYNMLISCFGQKQYSSCSSSTNSDLDDDGQISGSDYNLLLRSIAIQKSGDIIPNQTSTSPTVTQFVPSPSFQNGNKLFGISVAGAEFGGAAVYAGIGYNGYQYFHTKGLTLIRLPFLWERLQPTVGTFIFRC